MSVVFITYDTKLKDFLTYKNGIRYAIKGLNEHNKKRFFVYERNEKLNKLLDEYFK